ncbi:MAG TPA: DUF3300 domain-containing protein [Bryobacteraceae bacterium]|nr:DUF3300 domain-containing protein [Bryobacteraceae bacterium]
MSSIQIKRVVRRALCIAGASLLAGGLLLSQQAPPPPAQAPPAQLLSPQQLDTLVAPVALYPDNLLSQILAASTYPLEIAEAAQWLQQNPNLQGPALVQAARQQNWDASVQALVVFPDVLTRLSSDIQWTTDLGNAFLAQQADVMSAVQRMRARAMASGKLQSNAEQSVTTQTEGDQSAIEIAPANPEVVYVPYYNPEYIWGPPVYGYYPPWDYLDIGFGFGYGFGPGIYLGGFFGGLGWGGWGWGCNWFHHGLFLNAGFFHHYGFAGYRGGGIWAHNPGHRLGVAYPNRGLTGRYGSRSVASARSSYANHAASRYNSIARANPGQSGGWNHFGQAGGAVNRGAQRGYQSSPAYRGGNAYRASPSYGGNGRGAMPSYRYNSPSYGGRGSYAGNSGLRSAPSYGGSYGRGYTRSMPSYHYSPSYGGGGFRSAPAYRGGGGFHSSGGGGFHGGGGGFHSSGGGGFHGGGGGFHGGGGSHGGGGHR